MNTHRKAWLVGGGIGSMAAAAFMIRDGGMAGVDISILEAAPVMGGSLDGAGDPVAGYTLRGGRMLTTDNYECTWDLYKTIPSLHNPDQTVFDETSAFNEKHVSNAMARLVDRRRAKVSVASMGFSMQDRIELLELSAASEDELGASCITDWLSPFDLETLQAAICIPCRMPYITSMFMPRQLGDRPLPVPRGTKNFAFVSQFVEIAGDCVFTVEYSVRAAQMAVYELLGVERKVPAISAHDKSLRAQFEALVKAFK